MIPVQRGSEPKQLKNVRKTELPRLTAIFQHNGALTAKTIGTKYRCVALTLWERQNYKCCYCERVIEPDHNDVEHWRPKAAADRLPGSSQTGGYWWLAFTWKNLLFACAVCNRSKKKARFPLATGSTVLQPGRRPPGKELPLLIDPATMHPMAYVEYVPSKSSPRVPNTDVWARWEPIAIGPTAIGVHSIRVFGLARKNLLAIQSNYVKKHLAVAVQRLRNAISAGEQQKIMEEFETACGLFAAETEFAALSYDVLRHHISDADLIRAGAPGWPARDTVGR